VHVRYLKILEKSDYASTKWIRYLTKTGEYEHRITDPREVANVNADAFYPVRQTLEQLHTFSLQGC
jgi:hypothetical protein